MKCSIQGCGWEIKTTTAWTELCLQSHISGHEAERKRIIALLNWTHPESCEPMRRCDLIKEIEGLGR